MLRRPWMGERALEIGCRGARERFFVNRGNAFIEDKERILDEWMRLKKSAEEAVGETIANRRNNHALMMTHKHIDG